jgi:hypothetical protein
LREYFQVFSKRRFHISKKLRSRHHLICETIQIDFYGQKKSVPEILQDGLLLQSPVKGLAKEMKANRDKLRLKGDSDVEKTKTILNLMKIQAKATEHAM